jgi:hypothetical protein
MLSIALHLALGFAAGAAPSPPVVFPHAALADAYQQCLEEHDLDEDENDGECDEPAVRS